MAITKDLVDPGDQMIADDVHDWAREKHNFLGRYIKITAATRRKFLGPGKAGATFSDLFCATGRSYIEESARWIDGSAQMAWRESVLCGAPFSQVHIADLRDEARKVCASRLRTTKAPVHEVPGSAIEASYKLISVLDPFAYHLIFLDPYGLRELDFKIIESLSKLKRVDLIVHLSTMDLQRNLLSNISSTDSVFDSFSPGWRAKVDVSGNQTKIRSQIIGHWKDKVKDLGIWPSENMKLITGHEGQRLYWLLIAAKHPLAQKLWNASTDLSGQRNLFSNS